MGDFGAEGLTKLCISRVFCITAGIGFGINSGWHEQRSAGVAVGGAVAFVVVEKDLGQRAVREPACRRGAAKTRYGIQALLMEEQSRH